MKLLIAAALALVSIPALADDKCLKPAEVFAEQKPVISDPQSGPPVAGAIRLVEMLHGDVDTAKHADAVQFGMFPDHTMGVFLMKGGCMIGLIPVPANHLDDAAKIIMGEPA